MACVSQRDRGRQTARSAAGRRTAGLRRMTRCVKHVGRCSHSQVRAVASAKHTFMQSFRRAGIKPWPRIPPMWVRVQGPPSAHHITLFSVLRKPQTGGAESESFPISYLQDRPLGGFRRPRESSIWVIVLVEVSPPSPETDRAIFGLFFFFMSKLID